ncbi:hypothetical protein D3C87_2076700 [compost metagenome]
MASVNELRPGDAEKLEEEQVIQRDRYRDNADGAQVATLLREYFRMLLLERLHSFRRERWCCDHFFPSTTRLRSSPEA